MDHVVESVAKQTAASNSSTPQAEIASRFSLQAKKSNEAANYPFIIISDDLEALISGNLIRRIAGYKRRSSQWKFTKHV